MGAAVLELKHHEDTNSTEGHPMRQRRITVNATTMPVRSVKNLEALEALIEVFMPCTSSVLELTQWLWVELILRADEFRFGRIDAIGNALSSFWQCIFQCFSKHRQIRVYSRLRWTIHPYELWLVQRNAKFIIATGFASKFVARILLAPRSNSVSHQ